MAAVSANLAGVRGALPNDTTEAEPSKWEAEHGAWKEVKLDRNIGTEDM